MLLPANPRNTSSHSIRRARPAETLGQLLGSMVLWIGAGHPPGAGEQRRGYVAGEHSQPRPG